MDESSTGWGQRGLAAVRVVPAENPFPSASLGDIGRTVHVALAPGSSGGRVPQVSVSYEDDDLGWVEAASLRLFEIDASTGAYHLVPTSWVNTEDHTVNALVQRSGFYTVIGVAASGPAREAVDEMAKIARDAMPGDLPPDWHWPGCRISGLCMNPTRGGMPRAVTGKDGCQGCLGLRIPPNLLPEFQLPSSQKDPKLLRVPILELPIERVSGPLATGHGAPHTSSVGARLYALAVSEVPAIGPAPPQEIVWLEIIDTWTWTRVALIELGPRVGLGKYFQLSWAPSFGTSKIAPFDIAVSGDTVAVTDAEEKRVRFIKSGAISEVALNMNPTGCCFSPDGATLWVSGTLGLQAINLADGSLVPGIPPIGPCTSPCISKDGKTVAVLDQANAGATLLTVATLALKHVSAPERPPWAGWLGPFPRFSGAAFLDDAHLVIWEPLFCTMHKIQVVAGTVEAMIPFGTVMLNQNPSPAFPWHWLVSYGGYAWAFGMGDTRLTSVGTTLCVAAEQDPDIFPPGYRETRELVYADFSQNEWGMLATGGWDLPFSIVAHPDRAGTALVLTGTLAPNTYASSGVRIDERDLADHSASPPLDAARYTLGDDPFPDPSARPIRPAALAIDR